MSDHGSDEHSGAGLEGVTPILRVADFDASVSYYVDALGFELAWQAGHFGCVRRDHVALFLCEGSQGQPGTWLYIGVSDADALHAELLERGARIRHEPRNFPWGSRELHVFDPDGHVLRFGAEAPRGEPLGDWLDEAGVSWRPGPDGSYTRE
jgi:uncharacterized glyoxalase superfamily protein PhnB